MRLNLLARKKRLANGFSAESGALFHMRSEIFLAVAIITDSLIFDAGTAISYCPLMTFHREEWNSSDGLSEPLGWLPLPSETTLIKIWSSARDGLGENIVSIRDDGTGVEVTESVDWTASVGGRQVSISLSERRSTDGVPDPDHPIRSSDISKFNIPRMTRVQAQAYPCPVLSR